MKVNRLFAVTLFLVATLVFNLAAVTAARSEVIILQKLPEITPETPVAEPEPPVAAPELPGGIHGFTGLPLTADGWTDFLAMVSHPSQYNDSRIIYVSSSGNDATGAIYALAAKEVGGNPFAPPGPVSPYRTLAEAYKQLRSGYPDIILLKRGDTWNEGFVNWEKSGRSRNEPMILGAYGPLNIKRPVITRFVTRFGRDIRTYNFSHNVITSIAFSDNLVRQVHGENFLIEDCILLKAPNTGITIQGYGLRDVAIRRTVVAMRYPTNTTGHTQGIFASSTTNLLIEESFFDHNGMASAAEIAAGIGNPATLHNHNTYFDVGVRGAIMRYNISSRSSSKGFQSGGGGLIEANLSLRNPIGIEPSRAEAHVPGGLPSTIRYNVILDGHDTKTTGRTAWGIRLNNVSESLVLDNIIGNIDPSASNRLAIKFDNEVKGDVKLRVRNVTVRNNIVHNWGIDLFFADKYPILEKVVLDGNAFHEELSTSAPIFHANGGHDQITSYNNRFYTARTDTATWLKSWAALVGDTTSAVGQTNPSGPYNVQAYLASIGEEATLNAFFARMQQQRRGNWDQRYTAVPVINFVRSKFGKAPIARIY